MSQSQVLRTYSFLAALLCIATLQVTASPRPINYQGYLAQPDGTPIDTSVGMAVELWTAVTAGTLLYAETHASVTVSEGRFSIEIGTGTPASGSYDASHFEEESWLALTINGELLSPRTRLGAVAGSQYAEVAKTLALPCVDDALLKIENGFLVCYTPPACIEGENYGVCYDGDPATENVGQCLSGHQTCMNEQAAGACLEQVLPVSESCNLLDDDCNGLVDDGNSLPGCVIHYFDNDGDGYGDPGSAACLCDDPPVPNTTTDTSDCDDTDIRVRPGQTTYYTVASNGGTFDYNCNGTLEKQPIIPVASCTYNGSTCDYASGYAGSAPGCGVFGVYSTGCSQSGTTCTVTSGTLGGTTACH